MGTSENLIAYWEKWLDDSNDIEITSDGYIFKYIFINEYSDKGVQDWICCTSKSKLYSFIKYLILPSIQFSRTIGLQEQEIYFDVADYDEAIEVLEVYGFNGNEKAIDDYRRWFESIESLEENDSSFEEVKIFIKDILSEIEDEEGIYVELAIFENIKLVGKTLIEEYKEDNMIDELEEIMELREEEIDELFKNIDKNKFMLKRITTLLNQRFS